MFPFTQIYIVFLCCLYSKAHRLSKALVTVTVTNTKDLWRRDKIMVAQVFSTHFESDSSVRLCLCVGGRRVGRAGVRGVGVGDHPRSGSHQEISQK